MFTKIVGKILAIRKLPKKFLIPGILVLLVLGWFLFFNKPATATLEYTQVKKGDIRELVSASGTLSGKNTSALKFRSSGKLAYLNVKTGDNVTKGQVIAGLDTQDLNISLQQAQNTLRDKQAIVAKIYDDLKDHASDETYTQRQTRTTAEAARDNAYDNVKAAMRAFQDAVIVSPISGIVTSQADLVPGQNISTSDLIANVVDFSKKSFVADVDEGDISKISTGLKAEVTLNAYGDKIFAGQVEEIIPQTKASSNGATTITVKVSIDDSSLQSILGLNGQVNIIAKEAHNVLTIPVESLLENNRVIVRRSGVLTAISVETGLRSESEIEVTSGLSDGETIVKNPPANFTAITGNTNRNPLTRFLRIGGTGNEGNFNRGR